MSSSLASFVDAISEARGSVASWKALDDLAKAPDHTLIASLGCGSVLNVPVVLEGDLVATINLLHSAGFYIPERVARAEAELAIPARLCCSLALRFGAKQAGPV
jgi:hypothetical protein